jgi:hypothetical protein
MSNGVSGLNNNYQHPPVTTTYKVHEYIKQLSKCDYNEKENKTDLDNNSTRESTEFMEIEKQNEFEEKSKIETKKRNRSQSRKKIESTNSNFSLTELIFFQENNIKKEKNEEIQTKKIKFLTTKEINKKKVKKNKKSLFYPNQKKIKVKNRKKFESSRQDNDRTKFVRQVFNSFWYGKLPNIYTKNAKNKIKKFPLGFIRETAKIRGGDYLDKTIKYFYEEKKLYKNQEIESHFNYNKKMINKIMTGKEKNVLEELLDLKYTDLINEYLKSKEFQEFIESMKKKDIFEAEKFKFFAENFINNSHS